MAQTGQVGHLCYACGATESRRWSLNHDMVNNMLCSKCYENIIRYPQRYQHVNTDNEIVLCACGCGKTFPRYNKFGGERKYFWSSHKKFDLDRKRSQRLVYIQCRCGCGEYLRHYLDKGREIMYYKSGHYARHYKEGRGNKIDLNDVRDEREARYIVSYLYGYLKQNGCVIKDDICGGKGLYFQPLDNNWYNFNIENFVVLCGSHLKLMKKRKLSFEELKSLKHDFFEGVGKRRYFQNVEGYRETKGAQVSEVIVNADNWRNKEM